MEEDRTESSYWICNGCAEKRELKLLVRKHITEISGVCYHCHVYGRLIPIVDFKRLKIHRIIE